MSVRLDWLSDNKQARQAIRQLQQEVGKLRAGNVKLRATSKDTEREYRALARSIKQGFAEAETPQQRFATRMRKLNAIVAQGKITQKEYGFAARQANQQLRKSMEGSFGPGVLKQIGAVVGGYLSISAAIGAIVRSYQGWRENMMAVSQGVERATKSYVAFAALQEGGKKAERVGVARSLARRYGIEDLGQAFDTVQAMQSVQGSFDKGLKTAQAVFAATQVGMKLESAQEVATLAAGVGRDPVDALRRAHVAGELSGRTPEALAKGAGGLKYWEDAILGWAAGSVIATSGREEELRTYLKRGGIGLSAASGVAKEFEAMGLGADASQWERLTALHKKGLRTPEQLATFGYGEIREREAISDLLKNYDVLAKNRAVIAQQARPGLFGRERRELEEELPEMKWQRQLEQTRAGMQQEKAFGKEARKAQALTLDEETRALAMRKLYGGRIGGQLLGMGTATVGPAGHDRTSYTRLEIMSLLSGDMRMIGRVGREQERIIREQEHLPASERVIAPAPLPAGTKYAALDPVTGQVVEKTVGGLDRLADQQNRVIELLELISGRQLTPLRIHQQPQLQE